jgi:Ser/Thr protein kinase RdoA (MazF antagonist)
MTDSAPPHSLFDPDEAAAMFVLAAFGLDLQGCVIDRPAEARGFSGAMLFRVRDREQIWCLRRWPPTGMPRTRLLALQHFLRHLEANGIAVLAQPAAALSGDTLVEHQGLLWQLEPWLPGRADFHERPSEERLRSAVQTLAQIHLAAELYESPSAGRPWFERHPAAPSPACRERLQILRDWSPARCDQARADLEAKAPAEFRHLAREVLRCFQIGCGPIERELRFLHELPMRVHPCLRDIWHDHVLFTGEEVTGLVDPSAARTENVASDLSRLLGSLLEDDRPRWKSALAAYHEVRPLSQDERRLITALDRSSVLLSGLTWIDRCLDGQLEDDWLPRVLLRLETLQRRLTRLVGAATR